MYYLFDRCNLFLRTCRKQIMRELCVIYLLNRCNNGKLKRSNESGRVAYIITKTANSNTRHGTIRTKPILSSLIIIITYYNIPIQSLARRL